MEEHLCRHGGRGAAVASHLVQGVHQDVGGGAALGFASEMFEDNNNLSG